MSRFRRLSHAIRKISREQRKTNKGLINKNRGDNRKALYLPCPLWGQGILRPFGAYFESHRLCRWIFTPLFILRIAKSAVRSQ